MADLISDLVAAPSAGAQGWSNFGSAIGNVLSGGGAQAQTAYQAGMVRGAQAAGLLEQARERRNQNLAIESITPEALADPAQHDAIVASLLRAKINPQQFAESRKTDLETSGMSDALAAARAGKSIDTFNPILAAINGKPVELTKVEGNTILNPFATPDTQAQFGGNVPTAIGQADIGEKNAQAQSALAAAGEHAAQAQHALATINEVQTDGLGNGVVVNRGTGKSSPILDAVSGAPVAIVKGATSKASGRLTPSELQQSFGSNRTGGEPNEKVNDFLVWQASQAKGDPRFNDDHFALQQYLTKQKSDAAAAEAQKVPEGMVRTPLAIPDQVSDGNNSDIVSAVAAAPNGSGGSAGKLTAKPDASYTAASPAKPTTQAEFNALPKGSTYLNPSDGKLYRKN